MTEPLRVRLSEERQAEAVARELRGVVRFDLEHREGRWEVTVRGVLGDKLVVRVLNAVRRGLDGKSAAPAFVLLNGREYELDGE
jgi:hypothetical protein